MKILLVNYMETKAAGGINTVVRKIAKHLSERGHEITVLQGNPSNLANEEFYEGFKIIRVNSKIANYFYDLSPEIYFYLKKHLKEIDPDVIHIHGYHTLFSPEILFILKKIIKTKTPIIFTPHYDPLNHSTLAGKVFGRVYDKVFGKLVLTLPDWIVSVSNFEKNNLQRILNMPNITVIPHGVDFIDTKKRKRKKDDCLRLLYVGYLLEYKGVQHIIEALHELVYSKSFYNVKLRIVGEGKYKRHLISYAKKLNVYEFIEWKNFLPHAETLKEMKNADIFLLLSKSEGYGIVVAEALSMGTPAIVTKGTALEEFTNEPGCFGVDYPPNPKEVAELILKIVNSDVKVGPFSRKIRTWDKVAEDYEAVYKKVLNFE